MARIVGKARRAFSVIDAARRTPGVRRFDEP
jgi:hypothetical protein